ncbi:MAG: NAD+ synthase [bacterium]
MKLEEKIIKWIQSQVKKTKSKGIILGMSGGIDSAVVAILAKKAMNENVLGIIMPCESNPKDEKDALLISSLFKIKTQIIKLDNIYHSLLPILPNGNKLSLANLKPRLRMIILYYFANNFNYLVAGTGNKSEIMTGYFTKYGDGGIDILPIGGLLKTEIKELSKNLKIPKEIIEKAPSAGLWENQTDEKELGITYKKLDKTITLLKKNQKEKIPQNLLLKITNLIESSKHKRSLPKIFKP